ncbi:MULTISPECIES: GntR family transcriptional regulator [Mycobacteroides]|jgi:DNA-binding GntR family transcriptional regulator|uniref:GntR family transcriptional regulator n=1 Tax=Mycobacteroides chelonae TaxID=1774 RepID=A0A0E3XPS4_MYCCH|nr:MULTISPECIES: GntR family transcriptional regulator [Mycobacteroides]VEG17769.1 GntR family transcriptional regulator [Mycolicibacterium phlei]AKC39439.1 GntR family transcriptional regulator [Mycobacteroides chelonae]ANA98901.1 GntR family transcriptional regulator [Mycobacteroides chelonae CCUG 47445]KRQ22859.1 GntR family transcriptional regulator [Mycobacteroides sp. H072]KRQ23570.1 GntR family transcriptional regulator [Mycobacteroides sp. H092]
MSRTFRYRRLINELRANRSGHDQTSVLDGLRRAILDGAAPPGSMIPINEVADTYQISPIPVREALKTLVAEGLVNHRANGGYRVAQLTLPELREIYFTRGVLERAALAQAAALATSEDLDRALAEHELLQQATVEGDARAFHLHSRRFHRALVTPCGMHRLLHMFEATWNLTEPFQVMRTVSASDQLQLHADHEAMITAVARRDTEALLAVASTHHDRLESAIVSAAGQLDVIVDT